jgi:O-antigen chain-terminating methyltransferase
MNSNSKNELQGSGGEIERLISQFRAEIAATRIDDPCDEGVGMEELMRRLDAELGIQHQVPVEGHDALPKWTPAQPELSARQEYALCELLQFDDARFIETAYRTLLRRLPDPSGEDYYLTRLRRGEMSRIGVLAALRWSPEGVVRGVHVDGLLLPHLLERWQRWPIVGPVIGWFRGLARLHTLATRLETTRQAQASETQALGKAHNLLVTEMEARLAQLQQETRTQRVEFSSHLEALAGSVSQRIDTLQAASERIRTELGVLDENLRTRALEFSDRHADTLAELDLLRNEISALQLRLTDKEREQQAQAEVEAARQRSLDPLYSHFEDRFRGQQEDIRKRAEEYLPLVRQPGIGDPDSPVIDIGSGRGEWLDLLRFAGIHAFGIDTNQTFVAMCRERGLAVTEGDALATLSGLPDASAGAITSMHLVEHLPFETLIELIDQAHRVLKPGGVLVLETPNPENVNVGAHWFYLDPTHRNPLPPAMLQWLVQERGFSAVEIRRLSEHREFVMPDLLSSDVPGATQINDILAGYRAAPDYAVVAWRR